MGSHAANLIGNKMYILRYRNKDMLRDDTASTSAFIPDLLFTLSGNATLLCTETKKYSWVVDNYLKDLDELNDFHKSPL